MCLQCLAATPNRACLIGTLVHSLKYDWAAVTGVDLSKISTSLRKSELIAKIMEQKKALKSQTKQTAARYLVWGRWEEHTDAAQCLAACAPVCCATILLHAWTRLSSTSMLLVCRTLGIFSHDNVIRAKAHEFEKHIDHVMIPFILGSCLVRTHTVPQNHTAVS